MAKIDFLYLAMLADPTEGAGTNSPVSLTVATSPHGAVFHHRFGGTVQPGKANLHRVDVRSQRIESIRLSDISIQVGLLGDDEWSPDTLFLWGTAHGPRPIQPPAIVPLAIETGVPDTLSTGGPETIAAIPVRLVRTGGPTMLINRLLLIVTTASDAGAGSQRDRS